MKKQKFYAVRVGRCIGIYNTWDECKEQVTTYPNAQYKSFSTLKEALLYMPIHFIEKYIEENPTFTNLSEKQELTKDKIANSDNLKNSSMNEDVVTAYVDGSYCNKNKVVGAGGVIITSECATDKINRLEFLFGTDDPQYLVHRNVSGELLATMHAVNLAYSQGHKKIVIHYDYNGIELWATNKWKTNTVITKAYRKYMRNMMKYMAIDFVKVKAHSGDINNDIADNLAKKGLKLKYKLPPMFTQDFWDKYSK